MRWSEARHRRIYCSGAHGSGKTTLVDEIGRRWGCRVIDETARRLLVANNLTAQDLLGDTPTSVRMTSRIWLDQLEQEQRLPNEPVAIDRSLDVLAYCHTTGPRSLVPKIVEEMQRHQYIERLRESLVVLCSPLDVSSQEDPVRNLCSSFSQGQIDGALRVLFRTFRVDFHEIPPAPLEQRMQIVENLVWPH